MKDCTEIKSDVMDISRRIKEIDSGYFIVFNHKKQRFEVHHRLQRGGSFCLALPYGQLDARTLTLVRRTKSHRLDSLLKEIQQENQRQNNKIVGGAVSKAEKNMEEYLHENKRLHN